MGTTEIKAKCNICGWEKSGQISIDNEANVMSEMLHWLTENIKPHTVHGPGGDWRITLGCQ